MNTSRPLERSWLPLTARLVVGGVFVYLGLTKALDPVGFLKLVRQFDLLPAPLGLNLVAAVLPWLEIFCGALLILGVRVSASALVALTMLVAFTGAVAFRAWTLHQAGNLPFCGIRFDCGCGTGEVVICAKLLQNAALAAITIYLVASNQTPATAPSAPSTE